MRYAETVMGLEINRGKIREKALRERRLVDQRRMLWLEFQDSRQGYGDGTFESWMVRELIKARAGAEEIRRSEQERILGKLAEWIGSQLGPKDQ